MNTLNGNTSGVVNASTVTAITGTASDINSAYAANTVGTLSGLGNEAVTISDTTLAASVLNTLDGNTSGTVNATTVTTLTGTAEATNTALTSDGISNLGNEL